MGLYRRFMDWSGFWVRYAHYVVAEPMKGVSTASHRLGGIWDGPIASGFHHSSCTSPGRSG